MPLRDLDFVAGWFERRYAKRAAAAIVALYRQTLGDNPSLTGRELYIAVAAKRLGTGSGPAALVVDRADASFAQWPKERDVSFRDVVHQLVFEEYTNARGGREGTRLRIGQVVSRIVPADL